MPGIGQQTLKTVTTGTRFVTKAEPSALLAAARNHFVQNNRPVLKDTGLSDFDVPATLGHGYAYRRLVHIQPDKVLCRPFRTTLLSLPARAGWRCIITGSGLREFLRSTLCSTGGKQHNKREDREHTKRLHKWILSICRQ
jgi:hypothetical protein